MAELNEERVREIAREEALKQRMREIALISEIDALAKKINTETEHQFKTQ